MSRTGPCLCGDTECPRCYPGTAGRARIKRFRPTLKAYKEVLHEYEEMGFASFEFLRWFRDFIGRDCFAEINCEELTQLQKALERQRQWAARALKS
jgi:hypothetical protein